MAINTQDIHAAADRLVAEGQSPTLAAVRAALGGGSFTTISEAMKTWKAAQQIAAAPMREAAPVAVTARVGELASEIWAVALGMANDRLASERESLQATRHEMEQAQAEAAELADQMAAEIEQQKAQMAKDSDALKMAELQTQQQAWDNETMAAKLAAAEEAAHTAQAALAEAQKRGDELASLLDQERSIRSTAEQAKAAAELQVAVQEANLDALAVEKAEALKQANEAQKRCDAQAALFDQERAARTTAEQQAAVLAAKLEAQAEEKKEAWKQAKDAQAKAEKSIAEAAELRGQLAAAAAKKSAKKEAV